MGTGARYIIGHYQRHALANSVLWKSWACDNCGRRKAGVPASKLNSLRRNRLKDTGSWIGRLRAAVIRELQAEMARLQHELNIVHQTGVDPRSDEAAAVAADIEAVRLALGLGPNGGGHE